MTPAEVAALRTAMGLSQDQLAGVRRTPQQPPTPRLLRPGLTPPHTL